MLCRRTLLAAVIVPLLASCASAGPSAEQVAARDARLAERLAGKVAGTPVSCLPYHQRGDIEVIDSETLLFHEGSSTVYRQNTRGGCYPNGMKSNYALVTKSYSGRLCSGDIAHTYDLSTGFFGGSCSLTDFVPYRQH
jgi:hypothetical protein